MLQKLGHFGSRLASEMIHRPKCQFSKIFRFFCENPGQSTCLQKMSNLEANRGSKFPKSWGNLAPKRGLKFCGKWAILVRYYRTK